MSEETLDILKGTLIALKLLCQEVKLLEARISALELNRPPAENSQESIH